MSDLIRMCALPDSLTTEEIGAKWGRNKLLWCPTASLPGVSDKQWMAALAEAWGYWAEVCPLQFEQTNTAQLANILHGVGLIDGSGKTLAWSELPNGADTRLQQKYDSGERWVVGNPQNNQIDIVAVACHEIGHALGLGHSSTNGKALMDPYYSPSIRKPQTLDIQRIQSLYGKPTPQPTPPSPPPAGTITPAQAVEEFAAVLRRAGYAVSKA